MEHQRIIQLMMNWMMVNHFVQFEPEQHNKDNKLYKHSAYRVQGRDPFFIDNGQIPTETLKGLKALIDKELEKR
jgi:hypothetical protein